jgi:hypothetical protein
LTGSAGSATKTVNTQLIKRMEQNRWNWVTIASRNLGTLQSMTVQRDSQGNGPDWFLDRIEVRSARFSTAGTAFYNRWIGTTGPFTQAIV